MISNLSTTNSTGLLVDSGNNISISSSNKSGLEVKLQDYDGDERGDLKHFGENVLGFGLNDFLQGELSLLWIIFGTVGNLLSLAVLLRHKMRIHSTFTYLTVLSVCDTLVLYFGLMRDYLVHKYDVDVQGAWLCKVHVFAFYFVLHMASWLLVAVNIDRLIAASFLSLSKKWCTPHMALKVSFIIALVLISLNAHFLFFVDSPDNNSRIRFKLTLLNRSNHHHLPSSNDSNETELFLTKYVSLHFNRNKSRLIEFFKFDQSEWIIDFTLVNNSNSNKTQSADLKSTTNHNFDATTTTKTATTARSTTSTTTTTSPVLNSMFELQPEETVNPYVYRKCLIKANYPGYSYFFQNIFTWIDASAQVILPFIIMLVCNVNIIHKVLLTKNKTNGKNIKRLRKIKGMCVMIVSVSIIFFVLEAPVLLFICLMQGNYISQSSTYISFMWTLMNLMMYTNHVINFFSYCMTGTKFRRELIRLLYVHKVLRFLSIYKNVNFLTSAANHYQRNLGVSPRAMSLKKNLEKIDTLDASFLIKRNKIQQDEKNQAESLKVVENVVVKPTSLTSQILNKKAILGESAIFKISNNTKIVKIAANNSSNNHHDGRYSSSSSSSLGSSYWSIHNKPDTIELRIVNHNQRQHSVRSRGSSRTGCSSKQKTDNNLNVPPLRRRHALAKDDSELLSARASEVSLRKRSKTSVFRSLRFKAASKHDSGARNCEGSFEADKGVQQRPRKDLDDIDVQIEEISNVEVIK